MIFPLLVTSGLLLLSGMASAVAVTSYQIQAGESLTIAAKNLSLNDASGQPDWRRLCDANAAVTNPNLVFVGQELRVPEASETIVARAACELPVPVPVVKRESVTQTASLRSAVTDSPAPRVVVAANEQIPLQRAASVAPSSGDDFARLRGCESNGYGDKRNSTYRGAYQFDVPTWQSVGGSGDPADAEASEQDNRARRLQAREGWAPWPSCSAQLGLR